MSTYPTEHHSKRGPTIAANLAAKQARGASTQQPQQQQPSGREPSQRSSSPPLPSLPSLGRHGIQGRTEQDGIVDEARGRQVGGAGRNAFIRPGDAQFKVPGSKGSRDGESMSSGVDGRVDSSAIKTRVNTRFSAPIMAGRSMYASNSRPTLYALPTSPPRPSNRAAPSRSGAHVTVVEGLRVVSTGQVQSGPSSAACSDEDAQTQQSKGRVSQAGSDAVHLRAQQGGGFAKQSKRRLIPNWQLAHANGGEEQHAASQGNASSILPTTHHQTYATDVYSPYFQHDGAHEDSAFGQVEEAQGEVYDDAASDDSGRFHEVGGLDSERFDYDPSAEAFGAVQSTHDKDGMAADGYLQMDRTAPLRVRDEGGSLDQDSAQNSMRLIRDAFVRDHQEIERCANERWSRLDINDVKAWHGGGEEFALRFAALNEKILNHATSSTESFDAVTAAIASYQRDLERTDKKLDAHSQSLQAWGSNFTSSTI